VVRAHERSVDARFLFISRSADVAAKTAPVGRRASAYAKVMRDNGYDTSTSIPQKTRYPDPETRYPSGSHVASTAESGQ